MDMGEGSVVRKGELQSSGPRMGLTIAIPESAGAEGVLGGRGNRRQA